MAREEKAFRVAAVQAAPVFMDRAATVDKACDLIAAAGKEAARVIVFPEAFIPTYPDWVWSLPPGREGMQRALYGELLDQSVVLPGPETEKLGRAAKSARAYVVMGLNERNAEASGSSIYNTLAYIGPDGSLLGKHRKLMPTAAERLVWAAGRGDTLPVIETPYGKLGALICWENYMPLARYAMYAWGTQIYAAPTWDSAGTWLATLQHIAKEGRLLVIGVCMALRKDQVPDRFEFKKVYPERQEWINIGNSAIVNPDGHFIAGPVVQKEEILYADVEPRQLRESRYWFDAAGHYGRPDVFQLSVNTSGAPMIAGGPPDGESREADGARPRAARGPKARR
jgi:nitrilase